MKQSSKADDLERYASERKQGALLVADGFEDAWGWTGPAGEIRAARRADFLIEKASLEPGARCLEIGCGTGEFTTRLVESGCELQALEISEHTAEICRRRLSGEAQVTVGNIETGQGMAGPYDAIVGVSILHHLDLRSALVQMHAHLRRGGRFAFCEPNILNPQVWLERNVEWIARRRRVLPHETAFRARKLRQAFERAGFQVELCEPFEFLHPATPRRLIEAVRRVESLAELTPLRRIAGSVRVAGLKP